MRLARCLTCDLPSVSRVVGPIVCVRVANRSFEFIQLQLSCAHVRYYNMCNARCRAQMNGVFFCQIGINRLNYLRFP